MKIPEILIYTTNLCPYCIMAKRLLSSKNTIFKEINVDYAHATHGEFGGDFSLQRMTINFKFELNKFIRNPSKVLKDIKEE